MRRDSACLGKEIVEPKPWPFMEGDSRREPVIDHNFHPARVVRMVGYRRCMACRKWFWSDDVIRVRLCDCKTWKPSE